MKERAVVIEDRFSEKRRLRRELGMFDAVMLVMGGIIGAGIFVNPSEVAHRVHTPVAILTVWILGGIIALSGAFIWAELATRIPGTGGQYLYLREAYGRPVAFIYGWGLLLITQTGGMAAVAVTFAAYFRTLTGSLLNDSLLATIVLLLLSAINCFGARAGSSLQSSFMILKILAIGAIIVAGVMFHPALHAPTAAIPHGPDSLGSLAAAFVPVAFAYGGWQTATFVSGEMKNPQHDMSRGLVIGVLGVVFLYVAVNVACLRVLGTSGLDQTTTPATDLIRRVIGESGARLVAVAVAISTLGFLSQSMLTAPRVYYAMARDGSFFKIVGALFGKANAPVVAIALQGVAAAIIACSGKYGEILNFEVTIDFIFFALTAAALFVFRRRQTGPGETCHTALGHPWSTIIFIMACLAVVGSAVATTPKISLMAFLIMVAGIPVYMFWASARRARI